jgi:glycosyltransferase involved in cell wall biosynthesis
VKPFQWRALRRADLLHATSEVEYRQIREAGLDAPVVIIPNGVDLPPLRVAKPGGTPRTLLFLSRLHPIKGIDRLLHAWRTLQDEQPEWRLVLAGPGEANHVREIHELVHRLSLKRVELPGPLYGPRKASAFASADLFVLPSHSENFGMAVAEALAHACPVVVGRGAPWQGVEREGCGWWTSNEADALGATLSAAMALSCEEMEARGRRGRAWMERDFGWTSIGRRMARAYAWLLRNGSPEPEDLRS